MRNAVEIENIEEMRREQGIDDVELREEIRGLRRGDLVKVTLLAASNASETVAVRITSTTGSTFRGKLVDNPVSAGLSKLQAGSALVFSNAHIHSVPARRPNGGQR